MDVILGEPLNKYHFPLPGRATACLLLPGDGGLPRLGPLLAQRRLPQRRPLLLLHVRNALRQHELPPHRCTGRMTDLEINSSQTFKLPTHLNIATLPKMS